MSRHRHIRNLNIEDELDDDALSDGGEELTDEQHAQLLHGLEEVREVLGDNNISGLSDQDIKDALWEFFFDAEKTIQWAIEEQSRRQMARDRKASIHPDVYDINLDPNTSKDLPPVPQDLDEGSSNAEYYHPEQYDFQVPKQQAETMERSRVPLVFQHQGAVEVSELGTPRVLRPALSTITERTERTEPTPHLPIGRKLAPHLHRSPRPPSTYTSSSFGDLIEPTVNRGHDPIDPNLIPVSPSLSALNALSLFEPVPSASASDTASVRTVKNARSERVPRSEGLPEIPDYNSKASKQPNPPIATPKQSKLSLLASSRANSISSRSESSRSSGTTITGSVKTFPGLRPSAQSVRPPSSMAPTNLPTSHSSSTAPGENEEYFNPADTETSSMTSLVRRAINTAMELEALDNATTSKMTSKPASTVSTASSSPTPSTTGSLSHAQLPARTPSVRSGPTSPQSPRIYKEVDTFRTTKDADSIRAPSKLALLAQKSNANRGPKVPKPVTEYLTPTANGPTATTAITTSYQTLYTLTDPTRSRVIPPQFVVPLGATPPVPPPLAKGSKLAAKIRKAQEKQVTLPQEEEVSLPPVSPIFLPESTVLVRASPSAFASLLVDDVLPEAKPKHRSSRHGKEHSDTPASSVSLVESPSEKSKHKSRKHRREGPAVPDFSLPMGFKFEGPSPDDVVMNARRGTSLHKDASSASGSRKTASEREKALKKASGSTSASSSRPSSALSTPTKKKAGPTGKKSGSSTPARGMDQRHLDLSALNLTRDEDADAGPEEPPQMSFAREKLLEEARRVIEAEGENKKKGVSLVVVGHVDAGKSTLMGRLLYELGRLEEKTRIANERGSAKAGKSSFSWAWGLDGTAEERERGITMDIALQSLATPHRQVTVLDAPGHKDFIPNMISGASQADCALLVVDATNGEFEAGFERGGQTREHLLLVRSLGVAQVIVAVNKLDQVSWEKDRYNEICSILRPFLIQSGFHPSKTKFVPVGAMEGINLVVREGDAHGSGGAVSGRLCGGVVQVGERLRILPGDESAVVKSIEVDDENVPWAAAGTNATLYLTSIDPVHLHIGSVLCSTTDLVPLATSFSARIIVFDIQVPITAGTSVELFHHSRDVPATLSKLTASLDRATGKVLKASPRCVLSCFPRNAVLNRLCLNSVLAKGTSAEVQITLRTTTLSGPAVVRPIPLETFAANKDMGRILIRRGGETIGAGIVLAMEA
ncbi:hypothetical protein H0H87_011772 [Tephrocybe sp. NHM501043]|nr:hypothetical protein H0H87_011772 [Tephrocybe sp. NHM501043]